MLLLYSFGGGQLVICNRGAALRSPLEFFHFDKDKFDAQILNKIINRSNRSESNYKNLLDESVKLKFEKKDADNEFQKQSNFPYQTVGNCSWVSAITAVYAYLLLSVKNDQSVKETPTIATESEMVEKAKSQYQQWLGFEQMSILEKLEKKLNGDSHYELDHNALWQCFGMLHFFKLDAVSAERLMAITNKYMDTMDLKNKAYFTAYLYLKKAVNYASFVSAANV